ncbi:MAG TPA: hypothetical protein VFQ75_02835, partial [Candidatus Limnocylindrales bacterium]|nr:hypothetical protein [Candidatus Limnocylindrales bacterium]
PVRGDGPGLLRAIGSQLPELRLLVDEGDREAYRRDETAYLAAGATPGSGGGRVAAMGSSTRSVIASVDADATVPATRTRSSATATAAPWRTPDMG